MPMSMPWGWDCYSRSVLRLVWEMMVMEVEAAESRVTIRQEVGDWGT